VNTEGTWATQPRQVSSRVHTARTLLPKRAVDVPVRVLNTDERAVRLHAGTVLTLAEPVELTASDMPAVEAHAIDAKTQAIEQMLAGIDENVPDRTRAELREIMMEYADAFSVSDLDVGFTTAVQHEIDVGDARPVRQRLRKQPPVHQAAIDAHVTEMLRQGIIEPAQSPWAANVVMVLKKTGEFRCCIDFRGLNQISRKDAYCLPLISTCIDALAGAEWFSTFDLRKSYYQIEVREADRDKTAFICRGGQYRFGRMPMGLCNSGASFQRMMDVVLSGLAFDVCLAYIDDIIVYSRSLDEHIERLKAVLRRVRDAGLKIKPSKSVLVQRSVGFLGHVVSAEGVRAHPDKTRQIMNWGQPRCLRDARAFVGIASYYRKYVKDFRDPRGPHHSPYG
jgi:hypothetical protein